MFQKYLSIAARLIFASWYFGVGIIGFVTNDAVKDAATAATPLEKAMAESLFMNPLLCLASLAGGGAIEKFIPPMTTDRILTTGYFSQPDGNHFQHGAPRGISAGNGSPYDGVTG